MEFKDEGKFIAVSAPDIKPFLYTFGERKQYRLVIHRPSLRDYLDFEAAYAHLLAQFIGLFSGISFLTYKELSAMTALDKMIGEFQRMSYNRTFIGRIKAILLRFRRIFKPVNFLVANLDRIATKTEIGHILLFIHVLVEKEKKNSWDELAEMQKSGLLDLSQSSIFSKESSDEASPKFGAPMSFTSSRSSANRTGARR